MAAPILPRCSLASSSSLEAVAACGHLLPLGEVQAQMRPQSPRMADKD